MSTRFRIDLIHTGKIAESWQDRFTGPDGRQRLVMFAGAGVIVLILGYAFGIYLPSRALQTAQRDIVKLRQELAGKTEDLRIVKADLAALSDEARRQIRWGELFTTFSEQTPPILKLQKVSLTKVARSTAGQAGRPEQVRPETTLQIAAQTPLKPGGPPLVETAKFMAGVMRDPAINKRFVLRSWEIKPPASGGDPQQPLLNVLVTLTEKGQ